MSERYDDAAQGRPPLPEDEGVDLLGTPGPSAARRTGADRRSHRRRRRPVALLLTVLALVCLLGLVVVGGSLLAGRVLGGGSSSTDADYAGPGDGTPVRVQVHAGDSTSAIASTLAGARVVRSAGAFTGTAAGDSRSTSIQPGYYQMQHMMSARAALDLLLDPKARLRSHVTIPEGAGLTRTLDLIGSKTEVPRADLEAAVKNPAALGLPPYAKGRVEGFLFPATYDIEPGTTAVDALHQLTARFAVAAKATALEAGAAALTRTPYDVVTVASLVEREAAQPGDRPRVARVIYNRLARGMPLGLESTLRYALGGATDNRLTQSQIDRAKASPYSTYDKAGLPPGPIADPGQAALEAALHPSAGDALYFVTLPKSNTTIFTASYAEFERLSAQCRGEGGC